MVKLIGYILMTTLLLCTACNPGGKNAKGRGVAVDNSVPDASISRDKFEHILLEMHYAEAVHQPMASRNDSVWRATWTDYSTILNKYHVTAKEFSDTYSYYCYHSKDMDDIYQRIINDISIQQAQLAKKHK